jgi:hypothetical protein
MKELVISYLKQPSTYRGLAIVLGALGVVISPDQVAAIGAAVSSVIGAIEVFRNEHK